MSATATAPPNERLRLAIILGELGYRIFPLKYRTKEPATPNGFKDATSDLDQIRKWWSDGDYNIGLATGLQDNGLYVGVIDVDAKHGGVLAWKQLTREQGGAFQKYAPIHKTPRDGFHIFGIIDAEMNNGNGFPKGIDTRGVGGYVVVPDSEFLDLDTGEIASYRMTANNLWNCEPKPFPEFAVTLWKTKPEPPVRPIQESIARHPSQVRHDDDSPAVWMKANIDWYAELQRDGFTLEGEHGEEIRWTRPGKSTGTSLSLHTDGNGVVVVWSDNCPDFMTSKVCGQYAVDGHWTLNGFQYICARDFDGDVRAAMSHIKRELMPPSNRAGRDDDSAAVLDATPPTGLNLPPEFWTSRPWLTHVRDAAWAVGSTPDSQLIVLLARIATMVPPSLSIPPIVRARGSFDLMTVVVAPSGGGKSSLMLRAEELLPSERKDLRFGLGLASGEGIIESFYGMKPGMKGDKATTERGVLYSGVNFVVDEGALLKALAGQSGFTGVERLLTAWSGGTLSTANATQDRFRHVPAGTYRFTCVLGIQVELSSELWARNNVAQGFTGRLLMMMSRGGDVPPPGQRPPDPGPLTIEMLPTTPVSLTYPEAVWHEVQWNDFAKQSPDYVEDALTAHRDLQRLKVAGIFAFVEGRTEVTIEDWELATLLVSTSSNVRDWLRQQTAAQRRQNDEESDRIKGQRLATVANAEHSTHVARVARRALTFITKDLQLISKIREQIAHRDRKPYFDEAIQSLCTGSLVVLEGESIRLA